MAVKNHSIRHNIFLLLGRSVNFCFGSNVLQTKDEIITIGYLVAFGRFPSPSELKYWRKIPVSIHIKEIIEKLFASSFHTIQEKQHIINHSYQDALGRLPKQREMAHWIKKQVSFSALLAQHVEDLEKNPADRQRILHKSYQVAFDRPANPHEISYWLAKPVLTYVQLLAMHTTWKLKGQSRSQVTGALHDIRQKEISTFKFSVHALSSVYGAGGDYLIAPGGANVIMLGQRPNPKS